MGKARQESRVETAGRFQPHSWPRIHRAGEATGALAPLLLSLKHLNALL